MPYGFGYGPFGRDPFGEAAWSRYMFDRLPGFIKREDKFQNDDTLKLMTTFRPTLDHFRRKIRDFLDLRDPLRVRSQYDEVSRLKLGPRIVPTYPVEQRGFDAKIDASRAFSARSARFKPQDRGKELIISDSSISTNNRTVTIAGYINANTVLTDPRLDVDAGLLHWELRKPAAQNNEIITLEIRGGDVSQIVPGWQLFDGVSVFEVVARRRFRERFRERRLLTDKEGADATIDAFGRLVAPSANFSKRDIGRPISFTKSSEDDNNKVWEVKKVISSSTVELTSPAIETNIAFRYAFFPFPVIELLGPAIPRGIVEQEGIDLAATAPDIFTSAKAKFLAGDVGKKLSVHGSTSTNDGVYTITAVLSPNSVQVAEATVVNEAAGLFWEMRLSTTIGDRTQVDTNAPSMLTTLAHDFGLTIDTLEVEKRQRAWVQQVTDWADRKGVLAGYQHVAKISGFDLEAYALYHVSIDLMPAIPVASLFEVGDINPGRSGIDGSISLGTGGRVRFTAPSALITGADVGKLIRLSGTPAVPATDHIYKIENVIDGTTVEFRLYDTATLPDARTLTWSFVSLYTDLPPLQPLMDEINGDLMVSIVGPAAFGFDRYCWEPAFSTDVSLTITAVTPIALDVWQVTVTGDADVVVRVGNWQIEDSTNQIFFLDSVPIGGGPWTFEVRATAAPALGPAILSYNCPTLLSCDYCQSNKVLLVLTPNDVLNDVGVPLERIYDRVITRLREEVKPQHVEFIEMLRLNITATANFTATVEQTSP